MSTSNGLVSLPLPSPITCVCLRLTQHGGGARLGMEALKRPSSHKNAAASFPGAENHAKTQFVDRSSSPFDIDYLAMNCASSFRGLHEAVINHGGNAKPE